jgi:mRNA interferase RelE/StbE
LAWRIELTPEALRDLSRLGKPEATRIRDFLRNRLGLSDDPRPLGKKLKGRLREFWRFRVGDYRILARLENDRLLILVVRIGHRSRVYEA